MPRFPVRHIDIFMDRWEEGSGGCWNWTAPLSTEGYGSISIDGRGVGAHRFSYLYFIGPIAPGLVVDHLCRNHRCVNPFHLEAVTNSENVRRATGPRGLWISRLQLKPGQTVNGPRRERERKNEEMHRDWMNARYPLDHLVRCGGE